MDEKRTLLQPVDIKSRNRKLNLSWDFDDIQEELKHSDFFIRLKEILRDVLTEWKLEHYVTDVQDSGNADSSIVPDVGSAKDGTEEGIDLICYGLGSFSTYQKSRYQLGFLLVMKTLLHSDNVYIYDPIFIDSERDKLRELGLKVLEVNEEAKRVVEKKSIVFMPRCSLHLYNNLLWANWNKDKLSELVVIGNSIRGYKKEIRAFAPVMSRKMSKYVHLASDFVKEIEINTSHFDRFFVSYFPSASLSGLDPRLWSNLEGPKDPMASRIDVTLYYSESCSSSSEDEDEEEKKDMQKEKQEKSVNEKKRKIVEGKMKKIVEGQKRGVEEIKKDIVKEIEEDVEEKRKEIV